MTDLTSAFSPTALVQIPTQYWPLIIQGLGQQLAVDPASIPRFSPTPDPEIDLPAWQRMKRGGPASYEANAAPANWLAGQGAGLMAAGQPQQAWAPAQTMQAPAMQVAPQASSSPTLQQLLEQGESLQDMLPTSSGLGLLDWLASMRG